jgi:hypothetical protein
LQNLTNPRHANMPAFRMGSSERPALSGNKEVQSKPGPGTYNQDKILGRNAPIFGFGTENRPDIGGKESKTRPGPGTYAVQGLIGREGPRKSMSPKLKDPYIEKNNRLVPGPGNYNANHQVFMKTAPNFGFGSSTRNERKSSPTVDPGAYDPKDSFTKLTAPQYKVGTEQRKTYDEKTAKAMPGPGTYSTAKIKDTPLYSMGAKLKDLEPFNAKTPGAGTYDPAKEKTIRSYPKFSMGAKLKTELDSVKSKQVPGPGTYVNAAEKLRHSSPSFGFGTMERPDISGRKSNVPGPGAYTLKSTVGEATANMSRSK